MEIERVCEPTDVIWENRVFTSFDRTWKSAVKWIITVLFLILVGALIFYMQTESLKLKALWPVTDCIRETAEFIDKDNYELWRGQAFELFVTHRDYDEKKGEQS